VTDLNVCGVAFSPVDYIYVHSFSVAIVNDKLPSRTSTPPPPPPPFSTRNQPFPQLAANPPIYVFSSLTVHRANIVVCAYKLRITKKNKTIKNYPVCYFLLPPKHFLLPPTFSRKDASCFHLSLEWTRLSTVGRNGGNERRTTQQVTQLTLCPKTA